MPNYSVLAVSVEGSPRGCLTIREAPTSKVGEVHIPVGIDPECGVEEDGTPINMGSNDEEIIHNIINNCYEPND